MKGWIGVLLAATMLAFSAPAMAQTTDGARTKVVAKPNASELSARRAHRGYVYRPATPPYYPAYYARPAYYRPYPYVLPAPFFLGFAYLPFW
jgi:hypothetical protein